MFTVVTKASAVATIALPSSKGVCGVWVFTLMCLQQSLQLRYLVLTGMWCLGVYQGVFTAVATTALPNYNAVSYTHLTLPTIDDV